MSSAEDVAMGGAGGGRTSSSTNSLNAGGGGGGGSSPFIRRTGTGGVAGALHPEGNKGFWQTTHQEHYVHPRSVSAVGDSGAGGGAYIVSNSSSASSAAAGVSGVVSVSTDNPYRDILDSFETYFRNIPINPSLLEEIRTHLIAYTESRVERIMSLSAKLTTNKIDNIINRYEAIIDQIRNRKANRDKKISALKKKRDQKRAVEEIAKTVRTAAARAATGEDTYAFSDFPQEYIDKSIFLTNTDIYKDAGGIRSNLAFIASVQNVVGVLQHTNDNIPIFDGFILPYLKSENNMLKTFINPYKIFFNTLTITHSIYDIVLGEPLGLVPIYSPASAFDSAPETKNDDTYLDFFQGGYDINLQNHGFTDEEYHLQIKYDKIRYDKPTLQYTLIVPTGEPVELAQIKLPKEIETLPPYLQGNDAIKAFFKSLNISELTENNIFGGMLCVLCKALGDGLKSKMSKFYNIQGISNTVLTHDWNCAVRCKYDLCNVLRKTDSKDFGHLFYFFPKPSLYTSAKSAKDAAKTEGLTQKVDPTWIYVGGKRRTRSLKRNRQKGGGYTDNKELMHDAYIAFLLADVGNYCIILREYLSKSGANEKVNEILDFLSSKEYGTYLSQIDKTKSTDLFLKEISQWLPDRVVYRSDDMETFSDTISESSPITYSLHSVKKHFPMQGDTIEILGKRLNNNVYEGDLTVTINKNPDFKAILNVAVEKYNDITAKRLLDQGGVTIQTRDIFIKMLHELQIKNNIIPFQSILKAIFKEIIPDSIEASRLYNLFSLYVTFHGYHVLDYQVIQKFVSLVNLNKGIFPSGFDGMKIIVVGVENAKVVINGGNTVSNPTTTGPYEVEEEDSELQRYREQLATASGLGSKLPSMITVGGRRTRRRKAKKMKVKGSRRNRLTKKERNS